MQWSTNTVPSSQGPIVSTPGLHFTARKMAADMRDHPQLSLSSSSRNFVGKHVTDWQRRPTEMCFAQSLQSLLGTVPICNYLPVSSQRVIRDPGAKSSQIEKVLYHKAENFSTNFAVKLR
jgi:ABC-type antimicrobial peptide transport system ATPase subunit